MLFGAMWMMSPAGTLSAARPIRTPQELWAGLDPRAEPLEIQTVRKWTQDNARYHELYFTGETYQDEKVRVYAIYSAPVAGKAKARPKKLPGILHIHGGGQTVSPHWLKFWNARGYAALTFNWGGEWPKREKYTLWGKLRHGNHRHAGSKLRATTPSARASSWFHWTWVSRRALTVLERQKEVDPSRLGIFGVSMGGTIVWPFAAMDKRVKAACAIYGCGWNSYPKSKYAKDPKKNDPATITWRRTMAPEAYASLIRAPVLFLNATNDQHGKMDRSFDTLAALAGGWRVAYTPRYRHHIAEPQGRNLPLWMDTHLGGGPAWPKTPAARITLGSDGVPVLTVRPDRSQPIRRVELFYAVENPIPVNRYWRSAKAMRKGDTWVARLPVCDVKRHLFAFANVHYASGICLTSSFQAVIPAELGDAKATDEPSRQISDFSKGLDGFVTRSTGTDPNLYFKGLARRKGPGGRFGVCLLRRTALLTHKIGDPKWRGPAGARLAFDVHCPEPVELAITLHEKEFDHGWRRYKHTASLPAGGGWQTVTLERGDLKTERGKTLPNWRVSHMLEITLGSWPKQRPIFTNLRWTRQR